MGAASTKKKAYVNIQNQLPSLSRIESSLDQSDPIKITLCGLEASGKSTFRRQIFAERKATHALGGEIFGTFIERRKSTPEELKTQLGNIKGETEEQLRVDIEQAFFAEVSRVYDIVHGSPSSYLRNVSSVLGPPIIRRNNVDSALDEIKLNYKGPLSQSTKRLFDGSDSILGKGLDLEDLMSVYIPTIQPVEYNFTINGCPYLICDPGGISFEGKRAWVDLSLQKGFFEKNIATLFFVNPLDYLKVKDSLDLLRYLTMTVPQPALLILVFTHADIDPKAPLPKKETGAGVDYNKHPLAEIFSNCNLSNSATYEEITTFLTSEFYDPVVFRWTSRFLHLSINTLDRNMCQRVFRQIRDNFELTVLD